jgi:SAM-dependent methyltransferase
MDRCTACAGDDLRPHLRVAGRMDDRGLMPTTSRFGTALGNIMRCSRCGHGQARPMPAEDMLAEAYAEAQSFDYIEEEAGQRATARRWLKRLEASGSAPGELLDLGCWVGYLLSEAEACGWRATGVEPSEFASRFARQRLGLRVITGDLISVALPAAAFDVVTMNDVIEHLISPGDALSRIRALLRPGGLVGLLLPDAGSALARAMRGRWWSVIPTHVQYFTRNSIRVLLERHGFSLLEISTAPKAFTVRYYLQRVAGYSEFASRSLVAAAAAAGVADRMWAPDFRDRMAVIAAARQEAT